MDTSGLFAFLDRSAREHAAAVAALEDDAGPFLLSPFVLAELDYFVADRLGVEAELALLHEVASEAYELASFDPQDVDGAREVVAGYRDLGIGLADASLVVLAGRYGTDRVLTLDERHFRALRTPQGAPFALLPADA